MTQALSTQLDDGFQAPDFSTASRIKLSSDDPLAFDIGGERQARELNAIIVGGVPRYSAKDTSGQWHNFATREELDAFVDDTGATRSQKYQIKLLLPEDDRQWLFDLPYTSSIAFWQYKEDLGRQGVAVAAVVTRMTVERVKQKKDPTNSFSRVKFAVAGDAVYTTASAPPTQTTTQATTQAQGPLGHDSQDPIYLDEYNALCALPIKGKDGVSPVDWARYLRSKYTVKYRRNENDPITFLQLMPADRKAMIDFMREHAQAQGLAEPDF